MLIHRSQLANRELASTIKKMAKNTGRDAFIREERAIINRTTACRCCAHRLPDAHPVRQQDALIPLALHEEMAARISGSKLEIVEECGHLSTLERPAERARPWRAGSNPEILRPVKIKARKMRGMLRLTPERPDTGTHERPSPPSRSHPRR